MLNRRTLLAAALLALPLASHAFKHELKDFHDPALLEGAKAVEAKPGFAAGLSGGAFDARAKIGKSGAVAFVYDTSRSSGENAYRVVKVSSDEAPNLRWEVWVRIDSSLFGSRTYQKIMGPFQAGEEAKVLFVNNGIGQSIERQQLVVVYSRVDQVRARQPRRLDQGPHCAGHGRRRRAPGACKPGGTIIEPTSGNTGVGLAMVAAVKGYKLVLVMPDSMSIERRRLMLAYGASFDLTPREKGMKGAIARAEELKAAPPGAWIPQQFENPANVDVHVRTTAQEILADFPDGLDALITGVGTGGHLTGVARVLKPNSRSSRCLPWSPRSRP
jgi:hypothetical protein